MSSISQLELGRASVVSSFQREEVRLEGDAVIGRAGFSLVITVIAVGASILTAITAEDCFNNPNSLSGRCESSLGRDWLSAEDTGILYAALSTASFMGAAFSLYRAQNLLRNR